MDDLALEEDEGVDEEADCGGGVEVLFPEPEFVLRLSDFDAELGVRSRPCSAQRSQYR